MAGRILAYANEFAAGRPRFSIHLRVKVIDSISVVVSVSISVKELDFITQLAVCIVPHRSNTDRHY